MELGYSTALWHSKPSSGLSRACWQCRAPCVWEHIGRKGIQLSPWQQVILLQMGILCQKLSQNGLLQKYQMCEISRSMMSGKGMLLVCFVQEAHPWVDGSENLMASEGNQRVLSLVWYWCLPLSCCYETPFPSWDLSVSQVSDSRCGISPMDWALCILLLSPFEGLKVFLQDVAILSSLWYSQICFTKYFCSGFSKSCWL